MVNNEPYIGKETNRDSISWSLFLIFVLGSALPMGDTLSTKCRCVVIQLQEDVWTMERSLYHLQLYWVFSLRLYEVQHEDRDYRRVETLCLHHLDISNGAYCNRKCCERHKS